MPEKTKKYRSVEELKSAYFPKLSQTERNGAESDVPAIQHQSVMEIIRKSLKR